jgi:4a-hydroxytetrahydrobiopterin dehydratase
MARPPRLEAAVVDAWLEGRAGWRRCETEAGKDAITRKLAVADFGAALAFAVRLGLLAEKRDHHPDVLIGWGKVVVTWSTHDAGGLTELDLELAAATDALEHGR